jgi:hypothetical protein
MALGMGEDPNTLRDFRFGFDRGEEEYYEENDDRYEAVRWIYKNETLLLMRWDGGNYQLLYSDKVEGRDFDTTEICKRRTLKEFDPIMFKCLGIELVEGIPSEVTS